MHDSTFSSCNIKSFFSFPLLMNWIRKSLYFSKKDIFLSSKNATNPQWKLDSILTDMLPNLCLREWDRTAFGVCHQTQLLPGWLMCCWDRSFAMCGEISQGLCGSHMLDIPIETVKNRWSLGMDTMKQNSETRTIAWAVRGWQKL